VTPLEIWLRVTPGKEYIKLTVLRGKLVGALLIGDTELEEVCENLIMNALDIGGIGIGLLDPDVDMSDYFD
jgi:NAD(P)H-nitrite reductase large subunit